MDTTLAHPPCGPLRGLAGVQAKAWLGIPYALPPTGERRLRAPQPVPPWQDVRDARAFGPAAPQRHAGPWSRPLLGPAVSEDCLRLNVWSPAADDARRPVMVWIHGGAFILGSARVYDGAHLAEAGDIVVVTLNYRMGALGFINFRDALGDPRIAGNAGLQDVIAALRWVRENIAAFGGDPDRVTIAGESAGSILVSLLMACEPARPLFHRAIMQSGTFDLVHSREKSVEIGRDFVEMLGLDDADDPLASLQQLSLAALLAAQDRMQARMPGAVPSVPWFDDDLLPGSIEAARAAPLAAVPLLIGSNREEARLFEVLPGTPILPVGRAALVPVLDAHLGGEAAQRVLAHYPDTPSGNRQLATDLEFAMPSLQLADRHAARQPTWMYRFDARHPMLGAIHAIELAYLWDWRGPLGMMARGAPLLGHRAALAQRLRAHWIAFVRDGDPGDGWPCYQPPTRATMLFDLTERVAHDPDGGRRVLWPTLAAHAAPVADAVT